MVPLLDIIGPVMVGPSSSHTAGACRLGLIARALSGGQPTEALVELHGSFALASVGHGTDRRWTGGDANRAEACEGAINSAQASRYVAD